MRVELYIMRCKIDYLEALKEKLELLCQNRNIIIEENSDKVMYVNVYETNENIEGRKVISCNVLIEHRFTETDTSFSFDFLV